MNGQLAFDFDAPVDRPRASKPAPKRPAPVDEGEAARVHWRREADRARAYWKAGMVTSLPVFANIEGSTARYTQMLPGVVEAIACDKARVRIYAAPQYGYTIDNYPLHLKVAIDVPLCALGMHHANDQLQRLVDEGRLEHGDEELAARVRERSNYMARPA